MTKNQKLFIYTTKEGVNELKFLDQTLAITFHTKSEKSPISGFTLNHS